MLFGLFVSKKKYDELQKIALKGQDDLLEDQKVISSLRTELDKQIAVNQELRSFSESFKNFYQQVTQIPVVTKTVGHATTVKGSVMLSDREIAYGDVVSHMKSELIYDIAKRLEAEGHVKFDLAQDPITGGTAYTASLTVYKGGL